MSKGQETRERILDHAFRLASRDGLVGLSIGVLAGELGLSKSGLFAHFGSKEDLQIAVLKAAAERFEQVVVRPAIRAPRGKARIRKWFDNWLLWLLDPSVPGGCIFMAAAVELDDHSGPTRDYLVGTQKQLLSAVMKSAELAIEVGDFRKDVDCAQFAFEMYAIILGFSHAKRLLRDPSAEKRARTAFDRLLASSVRRA
jgi:AcrR family transcriptional regulator